MCFMSDMSTMGSALDNAVIPRYDAGMNPMDKRELYETTADICSSFRWSTCLPGFQAFAATVKVAKLLAPAGLPDTPIGSISAPATLSNIHHRPAAIVSSIELALLRESTLNS